MIEFNRPAFTGKELEYMKQAVEFGKLSGDGVFTARCSGWICENLGVGHTLLTPSCTHALEMAAYLADIKPGMR